MAEILPGGLLTTKYIIYFIKPEGIRGLQAFFIPTFFLFKYLFLT